MIHVLAIITAHPGRRDEILAAMRDNLAAVRAEEGCLEYGPAIDADATNPAYAALGPDSFVVIEKWSTLDALRAHAAAPHMQTYAARTRPLVASRAVHVLSPA